MQSTATRFIQESFAPLYPDSGDRWIEETTPLQPTPYNRTVVDAEQSAERFTSGGGNGIALRFAGLYGPDALTRQMIDTVGKGWSPLPGSPAAYFSSVAQSDAASAVVASLEVPAGVYNVVDDEPLTRRDICGSLASYLGVRQPRFLPTWLTRHMGSIVECMSRSQRISNGRIRTATNWKPKYASIRDGWRAVLHELESGAGAS